MVGNKAHVKQDKENADLEDNPVFSEDPDNRRNSNREAYFKDHRRGRPHAKELIHNRVSFNKPCGKGLDCEKVIG